MNSIQAIQIKTKYTCEVLWGSMIALTFQNDLRSFWYYYVETEINKGDIFQ